MLSINNATNNQCYKKTFWLLWPKIEFATRIVSVREATYVMTRVPHAPMNEDFGWMRVVTSRDVSRAESVENLRHFEKSLDPPAVKEFTWFCIDFCDH